MPTPLIFEAGPRKNIECGTFAVPIEILPTWHMTLDLKESAMMLDNVNYLIQSLPSFTPADDEQQQTERVAAESEVFLPLFVMSTTCKSTSSMGGRLQLLAQRLRQLQADQAERHGAMCPGRSPLQRLPMLGTASAQDEEQSVRSVGDMPAMRHPGVLTPKRGYAGENRHRGPAPHTIKHVMEEMEKTMSPEQCNEKIVNERLMVAQGKMLQAGQTNTMAINMSYVDYKERMGTLDPKPKTPKSLGPKLTEEIKEAATKELVERLQQTAQGSASEEAVKLVKEAAESMASTKGRVKAKPSPKKPLKNTEDSSMQDWENVGEAQSVASSERED